MEEKTEKTLRERFATPTNNGPSRLSQMVERQKQALIEEFGLRQQSWAALMEETWQQAIETTANLHVRDEIEHRGIQFKEGMVKGRQAYGSQFETADEMMADLNDRIAKRIEELKHALQQHPVAEEWKEQIDAVTQQVKDKVSSPVLLELWESKTQAAANRLYKEINEAQTRQMYDELDTLRSELIAELDKEGRFTTKALDILKKYSLPALGGVLVGTAVYAAMPPEARDAVHDLGSSLITSLEQYMQHQAETKMDSQMQQTKSALQKQFMDALGVEFSLDITRDDAILGAMVDIVRTASLSGLIDVSELMRQFSEAATKAKDGSEVITVQTALEAMDRVMRGREEEYGALKQSGLYKQLSAANPKSAMPLTYLRQQMDLNANTIDSLRDMLNIEAEIYEAERTKPWHQKLQDKGRQMQHMAVAVGKAAGDTVFHAADNLLMNVKISAQMAGQDAGKALQGLAQAEQQLVETTLDTVRNAETQVLNAVQALDKAGKTLANQIAPETQRTAPGLSAG